ncbi:hypothetical protein, partial [Bradyrhizobium uaiense]|uniref:hypothetical protein n=1 Tax=Bradyrhizobium uaiense TaxID=2594946 RepID=UPI0019D698FE
YYRPAAHQLPQSRHCLNGPVSPDTRAIHQNRRRQRAGKIALTTFRHSKELDRFGSNSASGT